MSYSLAFVSSRRAQKKAKPVDLKALRESMIAKHRNEKDPAMRAVLATEIFAIDLQEGSET